RELDAFVAPELDELERACSDRFRAHVSGPDMARIDRRQAGGEHRQKRSLWLLEVECDLVVTVRGHFLQIFPPDLARQTAVEVWFLSIHAVPSALDILRSERLAVVPLHAFAEF